MTKSMSKIIQSLIIIITFVLQSINPTGILANSEYMDDTHDLPENVMSSTVTHYLPYSPSEGKIRVSRTGLLYRDYYNQIGYPTVERSICTYVSTAFCVGKNGEYHDYNDSYTFTRGAIDFSLPQGSDVLASASGTVYDIKTSIPSAHIAIKHTDGTISYYVHVSNISSMYKGKPVDRGQKIAEVGPKDSYSTGAHLHYALWEGSHEIQVRFADDDAKQYGSTQGIILPSRPGFHESYYQSQNGTVTPPPPPPSSKFTNGSSSLSITQASVGLKVCADNLSEKTVYATLYRGAVGSEPAKIWTLQRTASSNCTTFSNMDGTGDTFANVTYYTVASLNPISSADATSKRTACYSTTGGKQLCDAIQRESDTGTAFTGGVSALSITQSSVNLEVCASNLSGKTVYATLYRDAYASYSSRTWRYQKTASSNCVTFSDMDGVGDTFSGITYYTVASLNPISDSDATNKRTACYAATDGRQLCDAKQRVYSGTLFENGYSSLEITQAAVNLRVCANNLSGKSVKATLYRDAYAGYPARLWNYSITASSGCVTFNDMDGAGDTFSGVTYYTVASLNTISDADASSKRTACYYATGRAQLCDAGMRGTAPSTCYSLTTISSPSAGGGIEVSPTSSGGCAAGSYTSGTSVTLKAMPASGYSFQSWSGASGGSTTNIMITGNKSVTANFTTAVYNTNWMPDSVFTGELDTYVCQIRNFLSDRGSCLANPISDVDGQIIDIPALIIEAAQQYEINPKVILATMQKEQSAITKCPGDALSALMGAGSPSTAREQIDFGTSLFRAYLTELQNNGVTRSGWKVGIPKTTVDGVTVTSASRAVAALFTYTPYAGVVWGGNMSSVGGTQLFKSAWDMFNFDQPFPAPECYSLFLASSPDAGGITITDPDPNCEGNKYIQGTEVSVWVIPGLDYIFDNWSGSISSEDDVVNIIMNSDKNVTSNFLLFNNKPSFTSTPVTGATQDELYTYNITATDPDDGDTLEITATTKPAWLTFTDHGDGTATLTGTPTNAEVGDHAVELSVEDSGGLTDTQSFTICVTD
ncbi:MAG: InlB B-repeat-containing protein, partial [Candidatus Thorarchaeota archaeon]